MLDEIAVLVVFFFFFCVLLSPFRIEIRIVLLHSIQYAIQTFYLPNRL